MDRSAAGRAPCDRIAEAKVTFLLAGKTAVVTGGGRSIGREICRRLSEEGARVVVADLDGEAAERSWKELVAGGGADAIACQMDATDPRSVERAFRVCVERFGVVDILVANAGIHLYKPAVETSVDEWRKVIAVNLTGVFACAREAARLMIDQGRGGRILFTISEAGKRGDVGISAYAASKFAAIGLLQCLALELAPYGITVNGVCPGIIETEMVGKLVEAIAAREGKEPVTVRRALAGSVPLGRFGHVRDVADVLVFLASPLASYITGETINVDGGLLSG
jgi:sorbitol-6-phosphate 2-dehydrogenase